MIINGIEIYRIEKRRSKNSVANIAVFACIECGQEKKTELPKVILAKGLKHRLCAHKDRYKKYAQSELVKEGKLSCIACKQFLLLSEFNFGRRGSYDPRCKSCETIRQRTGHLKRKYDMTLQQYENLLRSQGGGCAICGDSFGYKKYASLPIDHCHSTGKIRGILCDKCNQGLGKFEDNIERLEKAALYLKKNIK